MSARKKILVVDDDPDVLLLLRVTLAARDFEPSLAGDGQTALRRIEADRPDLVLLDVMMPVMDGWAVLEALANRRRPTPVVVVSAKAGEADVARALRLGALDYITKPFVPEELVARVIAALRSNPKDRDRRRIELLASAKRA